MNRLWISGYDVKYRTEVCKGILERVTQFQLQVEAGSKVWDRMRAEIKALKNKKDGAFANTWFIKGDKFQLMMVQHIKDSKLRDVIARSVENKVGPNGARTKVVEKGGRSIISGMSPGGLHTCLYQDKCISSE